MTESHEIELVEELDGIIHTIHYNALITKDRSSFGSDADGRRGEVREVFEVDYTVHDILVDGIGIFDQPAILQGQVLDVIRVDVERRDWQKEIGHESRGSSGSGEGW